MEAYGYIGVCATYDACFKASIDSRIGSIVLRVTPGLKGRCWLITAQTKSPRMIDGNSSPSMPLPRLKLMKTLAGFDVEMSNTVPCLWPIRQRHHVERIGHFGDLSRIAQRRRMSTNEYRKKIHYECLIVTRPALPPFNWCPSFRIVHSLPNCPRSDEQRRIEDVFLMIRSSAIRGGWLPRSVCLEQRASS